MVTLFRCLPTRGLALPPFPTTLHASPSPTSVPAAGFAHHLDTHTNSTSPTSGQGRWITVGMPATTTGSMANATYVLQAGTGRTRTLPCHYRWAPRTTSHPRWLVGAGTSLTRAAGAPPQTLEQNADRDAPRCQCSVKVEHASSGLVDAMRGTPTFRIGWLAPYLQRRWTAGSGGLLRVRVLTDGDIAEHSHSFAPNVRLGQTALPACDPRFPPHPAAPLPSHIATPMGRLTHHPHGPVLQFRAFAVGGPPRGALGILCLTLFWVFKRSPH